MANTRHIARRRLLKAAVFQPQQVAMGLDPGGGKSASGDGRTAGKRGAGSSGGTGGNRGTGAAAAAGRSGRTNGLAGNGRRTEVLQSSLAMQASAATPAPANLYRTVTGRIIDVSPHVIVIGDDGGERRFALTASAAAWRGAPLDPASLSRGDEAIIRLMPSHPGVADRIWANIGRVTGRIVHCDSASMLVDEGATKGQRKVVIPRNASGRIQVRFPNLQPGFLIDIIGIRRSDYLEGLIPVNPQPQYRSDHVVADRTGGGRLSEPISGSAIWHDPADEPYGVLGISYPAIDPGAGCAEDSAAAIVPGHAPAFRQLPYLAVGTALSVRNECTGIAWTLPVTGCAPMARLFNDRCVVCANSPRGRIADLTVATFVALGGCLEDGCFSATLTMGR